MDDDLSGIRQRLDNLTGELADIRQILARAYGLLGLGLEQVMAYIALLDFLNPRFPLPRMTDAAISPDFGIELASRIVECRPTLIVETGSGVSTLVSGYSLQKNRHGRMISLEHDHNYAEKTTNSIERHGLSDYVQVCHAPLVGIDIQGQSYLWYDRTFLSMIRPASIGLLLVDGPPRNIQTMARYPALPLLFEYLRDDALILIDDADRDDEKEMIQLWAREFRYLKVDYLPTVRGMAMITFHPESKNSL